MQKIANRFVLPREGTQVGGFAPTPTQQHFANECDVNQIVKRAKKTGYLVDPLAPRRQPQFDDYSEAKSYHEIRNQIAIADEKFQSLPAAIRRRFDHDPAKLLAFLSDEKNRLEAETLGLVTKKQPITTEPIGTDRVEPKTTT